MRWWVILLVLLAGCRGQPGFGHAHGGEDAEFVVLDSGAWWTKLDAEPSGPDGARPGGGPGHADSGTGSGNDSGLGAGADSGLGTGADSGPAGSDSGVTADSGSSGDSGVNLDSGTIQDSGTGTDSGLSPDSGTPTGTGDIWLELDYSFATSPTSPDWTFSNTPGWGAAQWATQGNTSPQAWDRFNNMMVSSDPIGTVLEIGPSSELQVMIGLIPLMSYTSATVYMEGRSVSTDSPVNFQVENPLNSCGNLASMSQDWTLHPTNVDLQMCMVVGGGVQAIRITPQDGTVGLVRLQLTIHGAVY
jgi:hypothetical protein